MAVTKRDNKDASEPVERVGRVRLPSEKEDADPNAVFHANAVLEVRSTPEVLPPLERHVAGLIDGFRPVARLRKKSGLSSDELLDALRALHTRGLLVLTGVIELTDELYEPHDPDEFEGTVPRGQHDVIPPHVMREIQSMIDEEEELRRTEAREEFERDQSERSEREFEHNTTTELELKPKR
jgi:hypothetical protein